MDSKALEELRNKYIKNPPEEIVVSVETLEKLMESAVTSLEEENGKLVMKLNLDRINISNQSANMFILCQNQQSRFMFAKFDSDAIENAIAYSVANIGIYISDVEQGRKYPAQRYNTYDDIKNLTNEQIKDKTFAELLYKED